MKPHIDPELIEQSSENSNPVLAFVIPISIIVAIVLLLVIIF